MKKTTDITEISTIAECIFLFEMRNLSVDHSFNYEKNNVTTGLHVNFSCKFNQSKS